MKRSIKIGHILNIVSLVCLYFAFSLLPKDSQQSLMWFIAAVIVFAVSLAIFILSGKNIE